jgi:hypothetical protein
MQVLLNQTSVHKVMVCHDVMGKGKEEEGAKAEGAVLNRTQE